MAKKKKEIRHLFCENCTHYIGLKRESWGICLKHSVIHCNHKGKDTVKHIEVGKDNWCRDWERVSVRA